MTADPIIALLASTAILMTFIVSYYKRVHDRRPK